MSGLLGSLLQRRPVGASDHGSDVSLLDELNWGFPLFPGVWANIDGSLMFGWELRGRDPGGLDQKEQNEIANMLSAVVAPLRGGYMLHVDHTRNETSTYLPDAPWPDRTSALIEEERRRMALFAVPYFESRHYLTVTVLGPPDLTGRVTALFRETDVPVSSEEMVESRVRAILQKMALFEAAMRDVYPTFRPLGCRIVKDDRGVHLIENDFARYLRYTVTGLDHPIRYHPSDVDMVGDLVAATEYETTGRIKAGTNYVKTVTVIKLPIGSHAGMTGFLDELQVPSRVVSRYITMTQAEAQDLAEKARSRAATGRYNWLNAIRHMAGGNPTHVNPQAVAEEGDAIDALAEASSPFVSFGHLTQTIVFYDPDLSKVEQAALDTVKALGSFGYTGWLDENGAPDAFIGAAPGHGNQALRRLPVNSVNFADLVPTTTVYTGPDKHPCPLYPADSPVLMRIRTTGASPYNLVLHEEELGFFLVIGPTRTGKTLLANTLRHAQMRYAPNGIYSIDYDASAEVATYAFGGENVVLDASQGPMFAPWANVREDEMWCRDYADRIVRADGIPVDHTIRGEIDELVRLLRNAERPSFTLLRQLVQGRTPVLRELFGSYVGGFLDAEQDALDIRALDESRMVTFDFTPLSTQGPQRRIATLMYLFRKIELSLTGRPNALFVDEAHLPLGDELIVPYFEQMIRRAAKANLMFGLLSQSIKEMQDSALYPLILDSFRTQIFLANPKAFEPVNYKLYSDFGLNDAQIREIASMHPRRDYYIVTPRGSRRVTLDAGPVALAFLAVGDKPRINRVRELRAEFPEDWQPRWLREMAARDPDRFGPCAEAADAWYHGDHNDRIQQVAADVRVTTAA